MFEWMPVLCGAVLGLLHRRACIGQRTLLCLATLCACLATALSGELFDEPLLVLVDLALVACGLLAMRVLATPRRTRRALEADAAVGAPHLRSTRHRLQARPTSSPLHHDESP